MRLDLNIHQQMTYRMILAPRMIQAMEILQLPILALEQRLQQELQENPVLEVKEAMSDEQSGELAGAIEATRRTDEILGRTQKLVPSGLVPALETDRAEAELARRQQAELSARRALASG
jgi:DNA-directed RNA polymerase specialized sigma54-like protein